MSLFISHADFETFAAEAARVIELPKAVRAKHEVRVFRSPFGVTAAACSAGGVDIVRRSAGAAARRLRRLLDENGLTTVVDVTVHEVKSLTEVQAPGVLLRGPVRQFVVEVRA